MRDKVLVGKAAIAHHEYVLQVFPGPPTHTTLWQWVKGIERRHPVTGIDYEIKLKVQPGGGRALRVLESDLARFLMTRYAIDELFREDGSSVTLDSLSPPLPASTDAGGVSQSTTASEGAADDNPGDDL